jgi:predicted anti-sigma-YlaC factor YlaD
MNDPTPPVPPIGSCERVRLLLSLRADVAATSAQLAEIDAHLPSCAACRRAAAVDASVRDRLTERVEAPAPAWLEGFAARTARAAVVQAREARAQNRLLWMSAAAAVLVAVSAQFAVRSGPSAATESASVRDSTTAALLVRHSLEGK